MGGYTGLRKTKRFCAGFAMLLLLLRTATPADPAMAALEELQGCGASVVFINVGKADSALLCVGGKAFLIDAGSKDSAPALLAALSAMGVRGIDGLFLTHADSDHIGGTEALSRAVPVERLYSAEISLPNKQGENRIKRLAERLGLPHTFLNAGDRVEAGENAAFSVLGPLVLNTEDDNDNSLVMSIKLNGRVFLFTGDMRFAGEDSLLDSGTDVSAHVLKVGHHGNRGATSARFVAAVSPEYAVISTNTEAAPRSAHDTVIANLFPASVYVTEGYALGIRMDISGEGFISVCELKE